jgi:hypothetical protein
VGVSSEGAVVRVRKRRRKSGPSGQVADRWMMGMAYNDSGGEDESKAITETA